MKKRSSGINEASLVPYHSSLEPAVPYWPLPPGNEASSKLADLKLFPSDSFRSSGVELAICCYDTQELIFLDDLLSALVGVEGRYISIKRFPGKDDSIALQVDPSMDLALQASGTQHSSSSFLSLGKYPYVLTSQEKSREVLPYIMLYLYMCLLP
ncbi:PREDICTED: gamma-tubulin complex component 2-like [Brassica oleracea var. oleracea]|uniref:gamma-tubulin complex component 2-like n=1 Tax=Brassica oleracea var. oleracea TaxID=109376 RepID=UPI0006A6E8AA|nr:PREDICTED: gamma-tubulin complex component 2-like [Brassica oleracea var. oleracea]